MKRNVFKCPRCNKITAHIEMSAAEACMRGEKKGTTASKVGRFIGVISENTGIVEVISQLCGRRYWKCCECGVGFLREEDGNIVGTLEY